MGRVPQLLASALGVTLMAGVSVHSIAETLSEALLRTYRTNPTLTAARADLRATDATVGIARSTSRPRVTGSAGLTQSFDGVATGDEAGRKLTLGATASMPIYAGGSISGSVRAAKERVEAGRASLRGTEGDVFSDVVASYMDVMLSRSVVELNRNQVQVLTTNLEATRDRFEIGDLTRTDVAQSEARLALASSALVKAEGNLIAAEQAYLRLTGGPADDLSPPPPLPALPETAAAATEIAISENPGLLAAKANAKAAGSDVNVARATRLPTLNATAGVSYYDYLGTLDQVVGFSSSALRQSQAASTVGLSATLPIYQGGEPGARVRRSLEIANAAREREIASERLVVANVRSAYAGYRTAIDSIESNAKAVAASRLALEGNRAENSVGTRTVLEVLDAEQELLNSEVALATARRDAYVAGFRLLNAMGRAEMKDLNIEGGTLYDPASNYKSTSGNVSDWSDGDESRVMATRTYGPVSTPTN